MVVCAAVCSKSRLCQCFESKPYYTVNNDHKFFVDDHDFRPVENERSFSTTFTILITGPTLSKLLREKRFKAATVNTDNFFRR